MDSPKERFAQRHAVQAPTRLPSSQVSPNARTRRDAAHRRLRPSLRVIQVPDSPRRGCRQASITSSKAVSARTSKRVLRIVRASERETFISAGNRTVRGSGLHHSIGWSLANQGKMPLR